MNRILKKLLVLINVWAPLKYVYDHRSLTGNLIKRRFSQMYRSSMMGKLWSIIHPLFMLLIYAYVFRIVFEVRWDMENANETDSMFAITMFTGMIFFNVFAEALNSSANVMAGNVNFVKKTIFPLELLPITQSLGAAITGVICFALVVVARVIFDGFGIFSWSMLLFPLLFILFLFFVSGICLFVASLGVYFRDTQFVCGIILQMLFFTTPIFYPVERVPEEYHWVLDSNPLSLYVSVGRKLLLNGAVPGADSWLLIVLISVLVWQCGWTWFTTTKKGFADVL
ncbi:MAG: ABC transporter permease [Lentisphaerae bacterium]|nr:ABC transporter permease [Lentisphaerota bacterium]